MPGATDSRPEPLPQPGCADATSDRAIHGPPQKIKLREDGTKLDKFKLTEIVETGPMMIDAKDYSSMSGWWEVWNDGNGNKYLASDDYGDAFYNSAPSSHEVSYDFSVAETDDYQLFGLVSGAHGGSNSFWVQIDGEQWVAWHFSSTGNGNWEWREGGQFNLGAGNHTLKIRLREDGAMLSKLAFTQNATDIASLAG